MPASSKQQFRFMKAIQEGYIKKPGLTKNIAEEFTAGVKPSKLPKFGRLKEKLRIKKTEE